MDSGEYLAFIPLLFYGIALADLLGQWRRFFDKDYRYLPYFLTTIVFTEIAVWNVFGYLEVVMSLEHVGYAQYWGFLLQPMLFLLTVSALTPESDDTDTEAYFKSRMSLVYGLMALFVLTHMLAGLGWSAPFSYTRVVAVVLCFAIAVTRRVELIYVTALVWLFGLIQRIVMS